MSLPTSIVKFAENNYLFLFIFPFVFLATYPLNLFDIYFSSSKATGVKRLKAILRSFDFWIYAFVHSLESIVTLSALYLLTEIELILIVPLAILSNGKILRSLTVKYGGMNFNKIEEKLDQWRMGVISVIGQEQGRAEKQKMWEISSKIENMFEDDPDELESEFKKAVQIQDLDRSPQKILEEDITGSTGKERVQQMAIWLASNIHHQLLMENLLENDFS